MSDVGNFASLSIIGYLRCGLISGMDWNGMSYAIAPDIIGYTPRVFSRSGRSRSLSRLLPFGPQRMLYLSELRVFIPDTPQMSLPGPAVAHRLLSSAPSSEPVRANWAALIIPIFRMPGS